jgi:hypothetical protein
MWICEFCFLICDENVLPSNWDFAFQSAVCPECKERVLTDGGYFKVKGGAYAESFIDPRWLISKHGSVPKKFEKYLHRPDLNQTTASR